MSTLPLDTRVDSVLRSPLFYGIASAECSEIVSIAQERHFAKGETIFFAKEMKCATCHKVGDKGVALGPDLSEIGKSRSRGELLEISGELPGKCFVRKLL